MFNKNNKNFDVRGKSNRFSASILAVVLVISCFFSGCEDISEEPKMKKSTKDEPDKLSIVTTIFPQYDFARQIAGDNADISMLLGPGEESHTFEPTPQDIIDIQNADIFIYVGGESEGRVNDILDSFDTNNIQIINMMDIVDIVEEEIVEGMEDNEDKEKDEYGDEIKN